MTVQVYSRQYIDVTPMTDEYDYMTTFLPSTDLYTLKTHRANPLPFHSPKPKPQTLSPSIHNYFISVPS